MGCPKICSKLSFKWLLAIVLVYCLSILFLYTSNGNIAFPSKQKLKDAISSLNDFVDWGNSLNASFNSTSPSAETDTLHLAKPLFYDETSIVGDDKGFEGKLVLFYSPYYGTRVLGDFNESVVIDPSIGDHKCPKKCSYTEDKSMIDVADAVVFCMTDALYHMGNDVSSVPNLTSRKHNQMWIGFVFETSIYHTTHSLLIDKELNWTATYRLDSDVYWPYGYFYKREIPIPIDTNSSVQALKSKTKLAATLISNCWTQSNREGVITSLKRYIPIDSYGGCGDKQCPDNNHCREFIGQNYKFFLAFENSLCQDYVTEKFFECFRNNIVPVAFGIADYALMVPPHSYINALDFESTQALAAYLTHLDQNDDEYLKYFEWKQEYVQGHETWESRFCNICWKLWEPRQPKQILEGFDQWWRHKRPTNINVSNATLGDLLLNNVAQQCVPRGEVDRMLHEYNFFK